MRPNPLRRLVPLLLAGLLAACAGKEDLSEPPEPMGDFLLGHAIVVDKTARMLPPSRKAEPGEWQSALTEAIETRLKRYDGTRYFHVAANVEGYALAVPGIPLIVSPKSALVLGVTVWDDARGEKLNDKPKQITVFESISGKTLIGSGLTQSKETQMAGLSRNAARAIHRWMLKNKAWFEPAAAEATEEAGDGAETPAAEVPATN